jgi:hypothetical protein
MQVQDISANVPSPVLPDRAPHPERGPSTGWLPSVARAMRLGSSVADQTLFVGATILANIPASHAPKPRKNMTCSRFLFRRPPA